MRGAYLSILMWSVGVVVPCAIMFGIIFGLLPAVGISPNAGINPRTDPHVAAMLALGVLLPFLALVYCGTLLAAWFALKWFPRAEVETKFLRYGWLPGMSPYNRRVFHKLFPDKPL